MQKFVVQLYLKILRKLQLLYQISFTYIKAGKALFVEDTNENTFQKLGKDPLLRYILQHYWISMRNVEKILEMNMSVKNSLKVFNGNFKQMIKCLKIENRESKKKIL